MAESHHKEKKQAKGNPIPISSNADRCYMNRVGCVLHSEKQPFRVSSFHTKSSIF